jgi:hypothetical protein
MANYFELFDDTRAGILGAIDRAVTEAHAWDFLRYWEPEWEMVPLPSIEQRLPNRDAYDDDLYSDCFDIIWTIARTEWIDWRESYIEENPACACRRREGKVAGYCWPRYPEDQELPMCEDIRNYYALFDNFTADRLSRIDGKVTERGEWETWEDGLPENNETFSARVSVYEVDNITRSEMEIISEVARLGWNEFVRSRDRWGVPEVD